jgi:predicted Zn-dependent protease
MLMTHAIRPFAVVLLLLFVNAAGCTVSEKEEISMGQQLHPQFEKESGGLYPDSQVQQYVNTVGMSVARYAGRPQLDWRFSVVNSDQINAFAVPGGYIYITQGLLFKMTNEAQLAGVLGHESGHIAKRHTVKQIGRQRTTQVGSTVVGVVGGLFGYGWVGDVTSLAGSLTLMSYSRGQEHEADIEGLQFMSEAGYNPIGMVQLMKILQSSGGGKGAPEFLSTHPNPGNRIEYLTEEIQKKYFDAARDGELGQENFQRNVLSRRP